MGLLTEFGDALGEGLTSRSLNSCSRWAQKRRVMSGDFAGNYSFKYHPWCKAPSDSKAHYNTIMKAAQLGLTEVAINVAFFTVDIRKRDVLYVLPTTVGASDFSKTRFNTALIDSPYLNNLFTDSNAVGIKQAGGTNLYIRGSRGKDALKSIPVSVLILDEADEMSKKALYLADERLSGQLESWVLALSTPTIPNFGIHKMFLQGTQEHFYFKCPRCGRTTEFIFPECLEICGESITDPDMAKSYLKCKECNRKINHEEKPEFLAKAYWEKTVRVNEDHRSFYVNQMYSFTVTPAKLAKAYFQGIGDEAAMVEFHNSKQGLPYIPDGGQVTEGELDVAVKTYFKENQRPEIGTDRLIVMGVDQGKMNNVVVEEFFIPAGSGVDMNASAYGKVLWEGKLPGDDFSTLDPLMREWQVRACVIDADPQINDARRFARRFPGYVYLCRYRRGVTGKELQLSEEDGYAPIVTVDRSNWFDASMGRFHSDRVDLPADTSIEFKEHVKAMVRTYEKDEQGNSRAVYLNTGPDHFAHAFNYAEIALPLALGVVTGGDLDEKVL